MVIELLTFVSWQMWSQFETFFFNFRWDLWAKYDAFYDHKLSICSLFSLRRTTELLMASYSCLLSYFYTLKADFTVICKFFGFVRKCFLWIYDCFAQVHVWKFCSKLWIFPKYFWRFMFLFIVVLGCQLVNILHKQLLYFCYLFDCSFLNTLN